MVGYITALAAVAIDQLSKLWAEATLAIGEPGAKNAGILAAQILALSDPVLAGRLQAFREAQTEAVHETVED